MHICNYITSLSVNSNNDGNNSYHYNRHYDDDDDDNDNKEMMKRHKNMANLTIILKYITLFNQ